MACSTSDAISAGPPRGIRQSTYPRSRMKATAVSCEVSSTSATASSGRPALTAARRSSGDDGPVGLEGGGRAAQEGGVARLQAQPGGVARHVGPVLVDHADDAERHPHPASPAGRWAAPSPRSPRRRGRAARRPCAGRRPWRAPAPRSGAAGPGRPRPCRPPRPARDRPGWPPPATGHSSSRRSAARRRASSRTEPARRRHDPGGRPDAARELLQGAARSSSQVTSTRSSRWTTTWLRRPIHSPAVAAGTRTRPLANTAPSGPAISTASCGPERRRSRR